MIEQTLKLTLMLSFLGGCAATQPLSFEEALQTNRATRSAFRDYDAHMPRMVALQYAGAARRLTENPEIEAPTGVDRAFQVPFAIWDFAAGNSLGGGIGVMDWFASGLGQQSISFDYFKREVSIVGGPNVSYYTFVPGNNKPTSDEVSRVWGDAKALFSRVFDTEGKCYQFGWTEERQYSRTYGKNVPGLYKEVLYVCPHPLRASESQHIYVTAWANPFPDTSVIGAVQSECKTTPKFADNRDCGTKQAKKHLEALGGLPPGWMQMTTSPTVADPAYLEVNSLYQGERRTLESPEQTEAYVKYLSERPYEP